VGGAVALSGWAFQTLRSADTTMRPDKPASRVIQYGPFGYSRNPIYVSFAMLCLGIAVLGNSLWPIVLLPLVLYVVQREERYLERAFGEEYLTYKARVRRWV
jgi:protein-S-isoprenylcysteine O-methyltransferase Ste14